MNINHLRWKDALHNLESSLNDLPASVPTPVMVLTMVTMMVWVLLRMITIRMMMVTIVVWVNW